MSLKRAYLVLFLTLTLESSLALIFPLPRFFPHFSILVLVYVALQEGAFAGFKAGLLLGFFIDMMSLEYQGTYTFLYAACGGICGLLRGKVFAEAFISQWVIPTCAYLGILSAVFVSTPFLEEPENRLPLYWDMIKASPLLTTTLVSPFVFMFCSKILPAKRPAPRHLFIS